MSHSVKLRSSTTAANSDLKENKNIMTSKLLRHPRTRPRATNSKHHITKKEKRPKINKRRQKGRQITSFQYQHHT
jgi:hypothetical protein